MRKIVLTYGLIAGAILSVMMLLTLPFLDRIGFDKGETIGYSTMVLAFLMVFFGVKSYRDNVAGGSVTFGRAFKAGLMITVVASLCYVATWWKMQAATACIVCKPLRAIFTSPKSKPLNP
jgi:hypothetical protein